MQFTGYGLFQKVQILKMQPFSLSPQCTQHKRHAYFGFVSHETNYLFQFFSIVVSLMHGGGGANELL